jgi:hypothetical protein
MRNLIASLALLFASTAFAASLSSVTLPDTATVGGQSLVLNGLGLREKYFIDVYVGGLYLPAKTTDASKAINDDVPKRIVMAFIYSHVTKDQLCETYDEGVAKLSDGATLKPKFDALCGYMGDVVAGDQIVLDYVPGSGTSVSVKGAAKGTIEGADFMRGLWTIYLGASPPTEKLKRGMLGGG